MSVFIAPRLEKAMSMYGRSTYARRCTASMKLSFNPVNPLPFTLLAHKQLESE